MTVEKEKTEAAARLKRQQGAEHDRAIAAEHDRERVSIEGGADSAGQLAGIIRNCPLVQNPVVGIALPVERRRFDPREDVGADPPGEPSLEKSVPTFLDAMGRNAERRRCLDDDGGSHSDVLSVRIWRNIQQDSCAPCRGNDDRPSLDPSRIEAMPDGFDTVVGERGFKLAAS